MNIYEAVKQLYPQLEIDVDFSLIDSGSGPELYWHNKTITRPTQADLERGWLERVRQEKRHEFARKMHDTVRALYPDVDNIYGGWVAELLVDSLSPQGNTNIALVRAQREKRQRAFSRIDLATNAEQIRMLRWEDQ
jgi:hypothetical protein